jgi:hypothetical protein
MPVPPPGDRVVVERKPVDEECPRCGAREVARYPVANFIGPRIVTKCQACFYSLSVDIPTSEDQWPPWRSATGDWPASRAG